MKLIQIDFKSAASEIFYTPTIVRIVAKREVKQKRKDFKKTNKRNFFALAVAEVCDNVSKKERAFALKKLSSFEIHHIVPLSLGGTNKFDNLALVEPTLHAYVHRLIDNQGPIRGDSGQVIRIPKLPGLVWGLK